jgi:thiol-disulfide isomerase/thioredoxin
MKKYLPWTARIVISVLFLVSAIAKMFASLPDILTWHSGVWLFEKQIVDMGITDWCTSPYLSRLIIALELAIGIGILQKHWLKRFVIPVTVLLLLAFIGHLGMQIAQFGANNGNCGCFGQLIPMTPLEALIKNILTIGLIVYVYKNVDEHPKEKNNLLVPFSIYAFSAWAVFMFFPFAPCDNTASANTTEVTAPDPFETSASETPADTSQTATMSEGQMPLAANGQPAETPVAEVEPNAVKSKFAEFTSFNGKTVNLDKGKKIVCCFAPGCDHCLAAATELAAMAKKGGFPEIYIIFMDEETEKIPDFFAQSKIKARHTVLDLRKFWPLMGADNTPSVNYMWNGNMLYHSEGTEGNAFSADKLKSALTAKN